MSVLISFAVGFVFVFDETYWLVVLLGFFFNVPVDDDDDDDDDVVDDDDDDDDEELLFPVSDFFLPLKHCKI